MTPGTVLEPRFAAAAIGGGAAALLLAAFAFQHLGGLAPCELCIWQRWPHLALAVICGGAAAFAIGLKPALGLAAFAALAGGGLAAFHVGVEQGWWAGLDGCTVPDFTTLDAATLREQLLNTPVVRCDEVAWRFLGLSMAGWNALISFGMAGLAGMALWRSQTS